MRFLEVSERRHQAVPEYGIRLTRISSCILWQCLLDNLESGAPHSDRDCAPLALSAYLVELGDWAVTQKGEAETRGLDR